MRIVVIALIVILVVTSFVLAFQFNQKAFRANRNLEQERYLRLTAEQAIQEAAQQKEDLKNNLSKAQETIKGLSRVTEQTQAYNKDLKERLEKASKAQEELEAKLKALEKKEPLNATTSK
ncbi:MAG: hypothetical protein HQL24_06355 [Candidatus Omnitrophica bacterium]|nr:hypothetical protein [Candidatus Omnitrophota bacterium]